MTTIVNQKVCTEGANSDNYINAHSKTEQSFTMNIHKQNCLKSLSYVNKRSSEQSTQLLFSYLLMNKRTVGAKCWRMTKQHSSTHDMPGFETDIVYLVTDILYFVTYILCVFCH